MLSCCFIEVIVDFSFIILALFTSHLIVTNMPKNVTGIKRLKGSDPERDPERIKLTT